MDEKEEIGKWLTGATVLLFPWQNHVFSLVYVFHVHSLALWVGPRPSTFQVTYTPPQCESKQAWGNACQRLAVGWEFFQYAGPADLLRPGSLLAHPSGCTSVHLGNSGKNQSGTRYQETPEVFGLLGSLPCSLIETTPLARRQESPKEEHSLTWFQHITRRIHFVQYFTLDRTAKRISNNNTVGKCITEHAFETSLHMPAESWAFVQ